MKRGVARRAMLGGSASLAATGFMDLFPKVWTDGQPAKQVLPDVQRELERVVSSFKF